MKLPGYVKSSLFLLTLFLSIPVSAIPLRAPAHSPSPSLTSTAHPSETSTDTPPDAAISSSNVLATKAGMHVLGEGGNAFDAAVAVSATLAVAEPYNSGLGGGGFWLLHIANKSKNAGSRIGRKQSKSENVVIDGREVAPSAANSKMYQDKLGKVKVNSSLNGPLAAGIPGEPAALVYINKHYGKLSLKQDLTPAIEIAKKGFLVDKMFAEHVKWRLDVLRKYPSSASVFLKNYKVPAVGDTIIQKDLANTLTQLADHGRAGFYSGKVADKLVRAVRKADGIWWRKDLQNYRIKKRVPLVGYYHNAKIVTMPPPSAGGVAIITMFNILSLHDLNSLTQPQRDHLIIEAMRRAAWQRVQYLGDPDFTKVPTARLISKANAVQLNKSIQLDEATPSSELGNEGAGAKEKLETTHFSILDEQGNRVAATISINGAFGSGFIAKGTGVLLNNEMDDFAVKPGAKNLYGLVGGRANAIKAGKRPLSSMTPTFLITPDRVGIIGSPGGSTIISTVFLAAYDFMRGELPSEWQQRGRFHQQYLPDVVKYEAGAFDALEKSRLTEMGYDLKLSSRPIGNLQAVLWDKLQNKVYAASDPRGVGMASVARVGSLRHPPA